jgi:hypothetical protein
MPRGIPRVKTEPVADGSVAVAVKPKFYICIEAFAVTLTAGDAWFRVGQRVHESHELFQGESGENRKRKLFISEENA